MKKKLLVSLFLLAVGMSSFAQNSALSHRVDLSTETIVRNRTAASQDRNITCSPDTALYPYLKESVLHTTPAAKFYTTYYRQNEALSQAYKLSAAATINGVEFYGKVLDIPTPSQTLTVNVSIFSVDANFKPTTQLATGTCLMTTTGAFRQVMFTTPLAVTTNFAIVITNPSATDTMQIYTNNADAATYGEALGYNKWNNIWYQNLDATNGFGQDIEGLMAPIIQYNIATDYTVSPGSTVCQGIPLTFTNTTTAAGIVENYMFNYNLFLNHFQSTPDSSYAWDMGDPSPVIWSKNANYAYPTAGTYTATLYTLTGLFRSCVDTKGTTIVVNPNSTASYTHDDTNAPTIAFTNTSIDGLSYSWDFGDGSPADLTANPSHTYTAGGTYTVVLTVTGACNTITATQTVTISATGINSLSNEAVAFYPNPAKDVLNIVNTGKDAQITIMNSLGQKVYAAMATDKLTIDTKNLSEGVYFISVNNNISKVVITK